MAAEEGFHPGHNPWAIALVVTLATFMEVLDTSIANVALQHIAGSLSAGQDESTWVLTSYLVSNAIVLPISGYLATRFGRKRFYMASVGLFTVSSLLCGLAPNLPLLILFRVLQGIGGGGLAPSEQSILADTFPPAKRGMAFAIYGMAVVLAPAMGPTLGGWITDHYSWRWVFFINIPVGVISIVLSHRMIKDPPWLATERKKLGPVDLGGFALVAVGLGALEIVLDKGQREDWFASTYITVFAVLSAVCLVTFVFYELRRKNPIVDVRLVMNRNFGPACLMMLVVGATLFGTTVLLPQFVQTRLGYTATLAGMALSPGGILIMVMMPFIGRLIAKVDGRKMIAFGFLCLAVSLLYTAHHFDMTMSFGVVTKLRMYQAAGLAFLFVPISTVAYVGIPASKYNNASGLINLARNLGGDIGIAVITTMLARRTQIHQTDLSSHTGSASHTLTTRLEGLTGVIMQAGHSHYEAGKRAAAVIAREMYAQAETLAYVDVLWLFAVVSGVMVPLAFLMRRQVAGAAPAAH